MRTPVITIVTIVVVAPKELPVLFRAGVLVVEAEVVPGGTDVASVVDSESGGPVGSGVVNGGAGEIRHGQVLLVGYALLAGVSRNPIRISIDILSCRLVCTRISTSLHT